MSATDKTTGDLRCYTCNADIPAGKPYLVWHYLSGSVYCSDGCRCAAGWKWNQRHEQHDAQELRGEEG